VTHNSPRVQQLIKDSALHMCLECGKCSASCPRLIAGQEYSPRLVAQKLLFHPEEAAYVHNAVWECLTCGICEERCPSGVKFSQFILEMREVLAAEQGILGYRAHDGALHSWMRIMTSPELSQNRLEWLTPDLKVAGQGKTAFFTGCSRRISTCSFLI
jgi:Fe-S oxidoreductase